ncbi:uncharacterized protein PHALS_09677 [Plasmopara halstedii]|uniref:RxLR-like protein n=1 Tax=Plasmopara halstedii TaxID=4781 RepID=A0A0P1AEJ1_PLAHL|nr:uncharacterized protein PHALS_09677 [Plasmopara halstedii]CEG39430.1 hypothetical protein PHALS_09677 [Plasmopara halstedii]|eukprot:XP_024575799.1 hypothetical protein PHALS_09677 [Plasmopara halstedii]
MKFRLALLFAAATVFVDGSNPSTLPESYQHALSTETPTNSFQLLDTQGGNKYLSSSSKAGTAGSGKKALDEEERNSGELIASTGNKLLTWFDKLKFDGEVLRAVDRQPIFDNEKILETIMQSDKTVNDDVVSFILLRVAHQNIVSKIRGDEREYYLSLLKTILDDEKTRSLFSQRHDKDIRLELERSGNKKVIDIWDELDSRLSEPKEDANKIISKP